MKDPLYTDENGHPYELLEIGPHATSEEINAAFRRGFAKPNRLQLRTAQSILLDPQQRALIDLLDYDDATLGRICRRTMNPLNLVGAERLRLSHEWWSIQQETFPNYDVSHSLAVLFFWWAVSEEEKFLQIAMTSQDKSSLKQPTSKAELLEAVNYKSSNGDVSFDSSAPALDELWKWAIAHWALLLESDHFWNKWLADRHGVYGDVNGEFSRNTRVAIAAKLDNCLRQFAERHREAGTTARSERLHQYELMLLNERRVGRLLLNLNAGIQTNDGPVVCGQLMLGLLGAVEAIRDRIAHRLNQERENVELQTLWLQLSKYAHILVLLERKDWQSAINFLRRLPEEERKSTEVRELFARAYSEEANDHAVRNETLKALEYWRLALQETKFNGLKKSIRTALVTHCKQRASALQESNIEEAIRLINKAQAIVKDISLDKTLSHLHVLRSHKRYQAAEEAAKAGNSLEDVRAELGGCIEDLNTAVSLDPENHQAAQLLQQRQEEMRSLTAPRRTPSPDNLSWADMNAEISRLEEKPTLNPSERGQLAQSLTARAFLSLKELDTAIEKAEKAAAREIRAIFRWRWLPRVPLYLALPLLLYLYYRSGGGDVSQWGIKFVVIWGAIFIIFCIIRNWYRSSQRNVNIYASPIRPCCDICLQQSLGSMTLPGRWRSENLCNKHYEKIKSLLEQKRREAMSPWVRGAYQDSQQALNLCPGYADAQALLDKIKEEMPELVADLIFMGQAW